MKQVRSYATMASSNDGSEASVERVEIDGNMVEVHEDLKELYSDEATLTRMMRFRTSPSGTFPDCGDVDAADIKPDGAPVQKSLVDEPIEAVVIDGKMVEVHEDLKVLYGDEATLTRMMRLRLKPASSFEDCGDIHSLDGWGTKGASPTIRMQLERGSITLEDTLRSAGQPGMAA
jgi:hypothetical protein